MTSPDAGTVIVGKHLEIDIYHGDNGEHPIDFVAMKAEGRVERIYIKASQYHIDAMCAQNVKRAQAAGFPVGCYHYMQAGLDGHKQGLMFLEATKGMKLDLPPCLDWESGSAEGYSSEHQQAVADEFIAVVEQATGKVVEIYGGEAFLRDLKLPAKYARHPLWLAHYQTVITHLHIPLPWTQLEGWQYSEGEKVAGFLPGRLCDASWTASK